MKVPVGEEAVYILRSESLNLRLTVHTLRSFGKQNDFFLNGKKI